MKKKIFFLSHLLIVCIISFSQIEIPLNPSENKFIKKWIVAKIENFNEDSISILTSNTKKFLKKIKQQ